MRKDSTPSGSTFVNLEGLRERVRLRAELMADETRLRNFGPSRERLAANGQDANAAYREIGSRRDKAAAKLKQLIPEKGKAGCAVSLPPPDPGLVTTHLVDPIRFEPPQYNPRFGYSGNLRMGRAQEGHNWPPSAVHGRSDTEPTGSIETAELGDNGEVRFRGDLAAGPYPGHDNAEHEHVWEHNWHNLIPFPAPVVACMLTYTIDVYVLVSSPFIHGFTSFWSYVYIGEEPNFTGQPVAALTEACWPLVVIDNFDGNGLNKVTMQRSFFVEAGHVPAVAFVMGVMAGLESGAEITFNSSGGCWLLPGSYSGGYGGVGVVHFRYDLLPPDIQI